MNSFIGQINAIDWKKIGKGAILAVIGCLLTYLSQVISGTDFGQLTPVIVAFWSVIANVVKKWLSDQNGNFLGIGSHQSQ